MLCQRVRRVQGRLWRLCRQSRICKWVAQWKFQGILVVGLQRGFLAGFDSFQLITFYPAGNYSSSLFSSTSSSPVSCNTPSPYPLTLRYPPATLPLSRSLSALANCQMPSRVQPCPQRTSFISKKSVLSLERKITAVRHYSSLLGIVVCRVWYSVVSRLRNFVSRASRVGKVQLYGQGQLKGEVEEGGVFIVCSQCRMVEQLAITSFSTATQQA